MYAGISTICFSGFKWSAATLGQRWDLCTWTVISFLTSKQLAPQCTSLDLSKKLCE